jgi:hypothetical protein
MNPDLEASFGLLDDIARDAATIRIEVDDEYRHAIALVEALPENQPGSDKTWVWRMDRAFREHYKRARRIR